MDLQCTRTEVKKKIFFSAAYAAQLAYASGRLIFFYLKFIDYLSPTNTKVYVLFKSVLTVYGQKIKTKVQK